MTAMNKVKDRMSRVIQTFVDNGARLLLDGRKIIVHYYPPMSATHTENEHFVYDITSKLKTKFLGNSINIYPIGRVQLALKRVRVVLDLVPPPSKSNNIILG